MLVKVDKIDKDWFDQYDKAYYSLENKLIAYNRALVRKLGSGEKWNDDYIVREDDIIYE